MTPQPGSDSLDTLIALTRQLQSDLAAAGTTEYDLVADFKKARCQTR